MSAVQVSGLKTVANNGIATFTFSMPGNFTAGNSALLGCSSFLAGTDSITGITVSGTAMVKDVTHQDTNNGSYWTNIWRAQNVAGGSATVVVTFSATAGYFSGSCEEFLPLVASALDQSTSGENNDAGGALTLTTGAKAQNSEVVYAAATQANVFTGTGTIAGPTSGYTQTALQNTAGNLGYAGGYKEVNGSGTESAGWTLSLGSDISGCIATYKKAAATYKNSGYKKLLLAGFKG